MTTYEIIRDAILTRKQVIATYNGRRREMCPHVIGRKNGRMQALFYQFAGMSMSGLSPIGSPNNWRCVPIDGLHSVETRDGPWYTGGNHGRPQTCVDQIDVQVTF